MAKKKDNNQVEGKSEILILPAEKGLITVEQRAKNEIAKFNFPKEEIVKLKKKYSSLKIAGIDDKKGYEAMDNARKDLKAKRVAVEKKRKEVKADYIETGKKIDEFAGDLEKLITSGVGSEQWCIDQLKSIDDEKTRVQEEERLAEEKKIQERIERLEAAGISWNGRFYVIGETITVDLLTLKTLTDEAMDSLVKNVTNEKIRIDEETRLANEKEEARLAKIEEDRLENERKEQELAAREKAIKDREEKQLNIRTEHRKTLFKGMGMLYSSISDSYELITESGQIIVHAAILLTEEDEAWDHRVEVMQKSILDIRSQEDQRIIDENEAAEKQLQIKKKGEIRVATMSSYGFEHIEKSDSFTFVNRATNNVFNVNASSIIEAKDNVFAITLKDAIERLQDFNAEQSKIISEEKRKSEQERINSLSDAEKANEFMSSLTEFMVSNQPEFSVEEFGIRFNQLWSDIQEAQRKMNEFLLSKK